VDGLDRLAAALRQAPAPLDPASFRVFPPAEAAAAVAEGLGDDRLAPTLDYVARSVSARGDFVFRLEDEQREVAALLDRWAPRLPLTQRHRLLGAPIPLGAPRVVDFARSAVRALACGRRRDLAPELEEVRRLRGHGRLEALEDLARMATLGCWLARRWPEAVDLEAAERLAGVADARIAAALASRPRGRGGVTPDTTGPRGPRPRPAKRQGRRSEA
jgi:hypothetical protein